MRRIWLAGSLTLAIIMLGLIGRKLWIDQLYPSAPPMPPIVETPVEDLISQHENFLKTKVPIAFAALQLGLTDPKIDTLEKKYNVKLPSDIRALYRWRNGTLPNANVDAFPDHLFIPLGVALATRDNDRKRAKAAPIVQRFAYETFAGQHDLWVGLIVDAAGDGYFWDPTRSESQGSFFFNFNEDGWYVFYPAFRNYLAGIVDGEKAGVFTAGPLGVNTADFAKAQQLLGTYGVMPVR